MSTRLTGSSFLFPAFAALGGVTVGLLIGRTLYGGGPTVASGAAQSESAARHETVRQTPRIDEPSAPGVRTPLEVPEEQAETLGLEPATSARSADFFDGADYEAADKTYAFPWSGWSGSLPRTEPIIFEAKYGHLSLDEIRRAKAELDFELGIIRQDLFGQRHAQGLSVQQDPRYELGPDGSQKLIPPAVKFVGDTPCFQISRLKGPDGAPYYSFDWLPPNEYPEYYETFNEVAWLLGQGSKLAAEESSEGQ